MASPGACWVPALVAAFGRVCVKAQEVEIFRGPYTPAGTLIVK